MQTAAIAERTHDDVTLIQLSLSASPGAFNQLVRRYLKQVYSFNYHFVQDVQMAEDITQETFLRAFRALNRFDQTRPFKPWLFTIATNLCKTALKKNQSAPLLLDDDAVEGNILENIEAPQAREDSISDEGLQRVMHQALENLSPSVRQAMILRHVHDLAYEEVAEAMDANVNTVRTWLKRGRESLKIYLETHGGLNQ